MYSNIISKLPKDFFHYKIDKLEGGASKKIIYRLNNNNKNFIVIDFINQKKEYKNHLKIYNMLKNINISIPKIIYENDNKFILLCEDFGDFRFDKILNQYSVKDLLNCAVDTLVIINNSLKFNEKYKLDCYNLEKFKSEIIELPQYYFSHLKINNKNLENEFMDIWLEAFETFNFKFNHFTHKDFNLNNLFFIPYRKKHLRCGVIDFQNAFWGENSWDLFSLLEDSRILFTDKFNNEFIEYYFSKMPIGTSLEEFKLKYYFLNCSRQTRLLGRWIKLSNDLKNISYLNFIPVTKRRLRKSIDLLNNKKLSKFYKTYVLN